MLSSIMKVPYSARLVGLLTTIIFFGMLSRSVFSPLLINIQSEFGMSLAQAGSVFLIIYLGYGLAMLLSGYLSARIRQRGCVVLSILLNSGGLVAAALCGSFSTLVAGLLMIGAGSGIYAPSGMAIIAEVVSPRRRGLAFAVHEMGPNLAFLMAPLVVLALYSRLGWRGILLVIVAANFAGAFVFARQTSAGNAYGQTPRFERLKAVVKLKEAWSILGLFTVAQSALQGMFAILPLYLVVARGLDVDMTNKLISASRISGLILLPVAGTLADYFGARRVIMTVFAVSGIATVFVGLTSGFALVIAVIAQPILMTAFYPAALNIVTGIGPKESRNVTFSVIISISVFLGNGFMPAVFGWLGDLGIQSVGFFTLAGILLVSAFFVYRNRGFGLKSASPEKE